VVVVVRAGLAVGVAGMVVRVGFRVGMSGVGMYGTVSMSSVIVIPDVAVMAAFVVDVGFR
jgi:hypothetical protein